MRRRRKESGFALLLVFLMAAIIALSLYMEIPRIAFESQRQKEQLLIERGEQYKRAIQVFFKTNHRYPSKIEELESLNNRRYLRKRFVDPMTGKDEWRLIHVNNGVLTDSVNNKQKQQGDQKQGSAGPQYIAEQTYIGASPNQGTQNPVNLATRRRPSDSNSPGQLGGPGNVPGDPANGGQTYPGQPGDPNQPNTGAQPPVGMPNPAPVTGGPIPGQPGSTTGIASVPPGFPGVPVIPGSQGTGFTGRMPGQAGSGTTVPVNQGSSGSTYVGSTGPYIGSGGSYIGGTASPTGGTPGATFPGSQGPPVNSQTGGVSPAYGTTPGSNGAPPGYAQPGMQVNPQGSNQAASMIQQILTTPRPGGMPTANPGTAPVIGGGIAGFASNADSDSIMVYNDHQNYGQWEFIFDPNKMKIVPNPNGGTLGQSAASMGNMPNSPVGTPASQLAGPNPFGNPGTAGTAPNPGFGQNPIRQ
jgi:type II secretory pathway pseudopilin PulG